MKETLKFKYKILQLPIESYYIFMSYEFAKEHGFDITDYKKVYSGEDEIEVEVTEQCNVWNGGFLRAELNYLYEKFNVNIPEDFKGHSMSVSDIILVERNEVGRTDTFEYAHYCDAFGWETYVACINQGKIRM